MKTLLTLLTSTILLSGCVDKNGFDNFNFSSQKQQWENNQINSRINYKTQMRGIVSAVYLNKVFPERYHDGEYFYVTFFLKDNTVKLDFLLNAEVATSIEELPNNAEFKNLVNDSREWNKYYIIGFAEQKDQDTLSLKVQNDILASGEMIFKKDE